jgi:hypothetical protein
MEFPMTFFGLVETLFSIAAIIAGLFSVVKMQSLLLHLKKTNYERWRELTTLETPLGRFGPGTGNPSKLWKYVKSNVDKNIKAQRFHKDWNEILRNIRVGFYSSFHNHGTTDNMKTRILLMTISFLFPLGCFIIL